MSLGKEEMGVPCPGCSLTLKPTPRLGIDSMNDDMFSCCRRSITLRKCALCMFSELEWERVEGDCVAGV